MKAFLLTTALALVPATVVPPMHPPPLRPAQRDSAISVAREALAAGRPWMATRVLTPLLRDTALRTPEVEYLAASAAAGWQGWREAYKLLERATWLDDRYDGDGHELMARAALGLARDSIALVHASRAAALQRLGRTSAAIADYEEALRVRPELRSARESLDGLLKNLELELAL